MVVARQAVAAEVAAEGAGKKAIAQSRYTESKKLGQCDVLAPVAIPVAHFRILRRSD